MTLHKKKKREEYEEEVQNLRSKRMRLESDVQALSKSADSFALGVDEKCDLTLRNLMQ